MLTLILRILNKLKLLKYLDLNVAKKITHEHIKIPIIRGKGYSNIFIKPDWLSQLLAWFNLKSEDYIVDVGSNIGQSLIQIKSYNKEIGYIGFEPNLECCTYLQRLIQANKFKNTIIQPFALSNSYAHLILQKKYSVDSGATVVEKLRPGFYNNVVQEYILTSPFDTLLFEKNKIKLVKIDVEGYEYEVLLGMHSTIKNFKPVIV